MDTRAYTVDNLFDLVEVSGLATKVPNWVVILMTGDTDLFLKLVRQLSYPFVNANMIVQSDYDPSGLDTAALFTFLPSACLTEEVLSHFELLDLNNHHNLAKICLTRDQNFILQLINHSRKPILIDIFFDNVHLLEFLAKERLFNVMDALITYSATPINPKLVRTTSITKTLIDLLLELKKKKQIQDLKDTFDKLMSAQSIAKRFTKPTINAKPAYITASRAANDLMGAIAECDLVRLQHADSRYFASVPIDSHPFIALTAEQQAGIYYYIIYSSKDHKLLVNFINWLYQNNNFLKTRLNLTEDHLSAYLGQEFNVASDAKDALGSAPQDCYLQLGIHIDNTLQDSIFAKLDHTRLKKPFMSTGICAYYAKYPENACDLEEVAADDPPKPLWLSILMHGDKALFIKLAQLQNKLGKIDGNVRTELDCGDTSAYFTIIPGDAICPEVLQYFKPFRLNDASTSSPGFTNLYHLVTHLPGEKDLESIVEHSQKPILIDFSAHQSQICLPTRLISSGTGSTFFKYAKYSCSYIDLSQFVYTGVTLEEFLLKHKKNYLLKVIKEVNAKHPRLVVKNKSKPESTPPAASIPPAAAKQPAQAKKESEVPTKTDNNSKLSQLRSLLTKVTQALEIDFEITVDGTTGCTVLLKGARMTELAPLLKHFPKCKVDANSAVFTGSINAILKAIRLAASASTPSDNPNKTDVKVEFTEAKIISMRESLHHAFAQEEKTKITWDSKKEYFVISYRTDVWTIREYQSRSGALFVVNVDPGDINTVVIPRIIAHLTEKKDVEARHDDSNNELIIIPKRDAIQTSVNLHIITFNMITTKNRAIAAPPLAKPVAVAAPVAALPKPAAAKPEATRLTLFSNEKLKDKEKKAAEQALIKCFKHICSMASDLPSNSFEFLDGEFLKQNRKLSLSFSTKPRPTIGQIPTDVLFSALSVAINLQLPDKTSFRCLDNDACYFILHTSLTELQGLNLEAIKEHLKDNAKPREIKPTANNLLTQACSVPAHIAKGLNTSDHTYQSIEVMLLDALGAPLCAINGLTWNLMNRGISKQDNADLNKLNWSNNGFNHTEGKEYFDRKQRQLDKILDLLGDEQDFMFLQEIDILTYPKHANEEDRQKHEDIKSAFLAKLSKVGEEGWSYCSSYGEGNRALVTLYNKKRLTFLNQQKSIFNGTAFECKFKTNNQKFVTLTNIHLDYNNTNPLIIDGYQRAQIQNNEFTIIGGDTNLRDNLLGMLIDPEISTNIFAVEQNREVFISDRLENSKKKRGIDGFAVNPTETTQVVVRPGNSEVFEFNAVKNEYRVVPWLPQKNDASCKHVSAIGQPCVATPKVVPPEAVRLEKLQPRI